MPQRHRQYKKGVRNLGNLRVINPNTSAGKPQSTAAKSASSNVNLNVPVSSDTSKPTALPPLKVTPSKEKALQEETAVKKTVGKAKTDVEMPLNNEFGYGKGRVTRSMSQQQSKASNERSDGLNNFKSPEKKYSPASKKTPNKLKDLSPQQEVQSKRYPTRSTAKDFFEQEERRVVRMKDPHVDSRRDFVERERTVSKRESSRRASRVFPEHRAVSERELFEWNLSERGRKGPSTSRSFSSRREEEKYFNEKYQSSQRQKNKRSRGFKWNDRPFQKNNPYKWYRKDNESARHPPEARDNLDEASDGPIDETDFEEVEVASVEDASKGTEIPVGFRKYTLKYLKFKRYAFFKPKMYYICPERTVVNCLSMTENGSVDVLSETECKRELEKLTTYPKVSDKNDLEEATKAVKKSSVTNDNIEEQLKDVEMVSKEDQVKQVSTKDILVITLDSSPEKVSNSLDSSPAESGISGLAENIKEQDSSNKLNSMDAQKSSLKQHSRIYQKCVPESDTTEEFYQGPSKIQSDLDAWKSHLIGLEFILEIQDNSNKAVVEKFYCELCSEDILSAENVGQIVINHINDYKHMSNYMARLFPSCGYKFSESMRSYNNEILLRKCCEEVNRKFGYHFMCITNNDYFSDHSNYIKKVFDKVTDKMKGILIIDIDYHLNQLRSIISEEGVTVMDNVINQILPSEERAENKTSTGEEIETFITSRKKSDPKKRRLNVCIDVHNPMNNANDSGGKEKLTDSGRTLILLTPQHESPQKTVSVRNNIPVLTKTVPVPLSTSNHQLIPVHSNLVPVQKQQFASYSQLLGMSNIKKSNKTVAASKMNSDKKLFVEANKDTTSPVLQDTALSSGASIKSSGKKPARFQNNQVQSNVFVQGTTDENESPSSVRTVRKVLKGNNDVSVEAKCDKSVKVKKAVGNSEVDVIDLEVMPSINVVGVQDESNHSDTVSESKLNVSPKPNVDEVLGHKAKSSSKQRSHPKTTQHSKYCIKRIISRSMGSKSNKETTKKELIDSVDEVLDEKDDSDSVQIVDDYNYQDSKYASSSLKRERSPRSSHSPGLSFEISRRLSRSPVGRRSRSPNKKRSLTPVRKRDSPHRKRSKSPVSRYNRSSYRRRSRSSGRRSSRSPIRRQSRSPLRRQSRSPLRRRSRSPLRRRSRSPYRKRSRSPYRRRSRSPIRRRSRSPVSNIYRLQTQRRPRSPIKRISRQHSRSPIRRKSQSPVRRSPSKRYSRSPFRRRSKSPMDLWQESIMEARALEKSWRDPSPPLKHSKKSDSASGSYRKQRPSRYSVHSYNLEAELGRSMSDLDSISDEDESTYFSTSEKPQYMEEIMKLPEPTRSMILQFLQKHTNVNPKDPSFSNFMQFVNTHRDLLQQFVGMQNPSMVSDVFTSNTPEEQNVNPRDAFLQHYLLSNLAANRAKQGQSANIPFPTPIPGSGIPFPPPTFVRPPYQQPSIPRFPMPNVMPPMQSQPHAQHGFPTGLQQRPPLPENQYHQQNHPLLHQRKAPSEIIFKDLKATVSKLFGANEGAPNESMGHLTMPGVSKPETDKWGIQTAAPQFNAPSEFYNPDVAVVPHTNYPKVNNPETHFSPPEQVAVDKQRLSVPPPDAKVSFCDAPRAPINKNLFPVVRNPDINVGRNPDINVGRNPDINVGRNPDINVGRNPDINVGRNPDINVGRNPDINVGRNPDINVGRNPDINVGRNPDINVARNPDINRNSSEISRNTQSSVNVNEAKISLAQRLAAVLVKCGMVDVSASLLQEMLMKIGAFSLNPPQDINEEEILDILRRLRYV